MGPSSHPVQRAVPATVADLEMLPDNVKGEILEGVLYTQPRPRARHQRIGTRVSAELGSPFDWGRQGPGGWLILIEPGIELPGSPEFSPDIAAWRRARLPHLPEDALDLAPDWVCEVHSPSTRGYDLVTKRRFYAKIGVGYLWYIDPDAQSLSVSKLVDEHWYEVGVWGGSDLVRAEPFDAIEIPVREWWEN